MSRRPLPLAKFHGLLEPGPGVRVTTARGDRRDLLAMSWHTLLEFEPPLVGCVISNCNHSFKLLKASRECALNIPAVDLAEQVVSCGNISGARVDKFKLFGLTPVAASRVGAPLLAGCFAHLECRVVAARRVPKYCFFVLEVVKAWSDPAVKAPLTLHHRGRAMFMVAGAEIKLRSKMK